LGFAYWVPLVCRFDLLIGGCDHVAGGLLVPLEVLITLEVLAAHFTEAELRVAGH